MAECVTETRRKKGLSRVLTRSVRFVAMKDGARGAEGKEGADRLIHQHQKRNFVLIVILIPSTKEILIASL